jgi:hypothetical protein
MSGARAQEAPLFGLVLVIGAEDAGVIPAFAEPGGFGMLVDDVSYRNLQKLPQSTQESRYRNAIAARSITTFDTHDPADSWDALAVPTLVVARGAPEDPV